MGSVGRQAKGEFSESQLGFILKVRSQLGRLSQQCIVTVT
tara:strand:- start:359 stop:478 length:120 start_codon:yes stop_codon:yes gene_type:complete